MLECAKFEAAVFFWDSWSRGKDEEKNKMAANVVADAAWEAAFMAFEAEFTRNG